ncbi:MAG: hypothetical protein M3P15_09725, partial [Actinomycetota bacterium]|nr:hypothetical protein [Actinomycetota bacterium]
PGAREEYERGAEGAHNRRDVRRLASAQGPVRNGWLRAWWSKSKHCKDAGSVNMRAYWRD